MADDKINNRDQEPKIISAKEARTEYFANLERWLLELRAWQSVAAMFPYYLMSGQFMQQTNRALFPNQVPSTATSTTASDDQSDSEDDSSGQGNNNRESRRIDPPPTFDGIECRIPPIWKRFVAELIDSSVGFLIKLLISRLTMHVIIDPYIAIDWTQTGLRFADYKMMMEFLSRILAWEFVTKLFSGIYETACLYRGHFGRVGGATPGKHLMGLRVIQCRNIAPVNPAEGDEIVLVSPGTDLGLPLALSRTIIKSVITAFLFPMCFSLFSFRFNRTGYDLACQTLVVEDSDRNPIYRPHQQ